MAALLLASVSLLVSALLFTKVGNQNHDIATGGREVARRGCELQNTTRKTLQGILKDTEPRLRQYAREGTLTQKQLNDALKDSKKAQNKLNPINCWKFASHIPVP